MMRSAKIKRETKETSIELFLNIDGSGKATIDTQLGYLNHMLELLTFWAKFDLELKARGDLEVDSHHTIEDIGICLGQALCKGWGERIGIVRIADVKVPMDEALVEVVVDISGRPYFVAKGYENIPSIVFGEEKDVFREFFKSLSFSGKFNLHMLWKYGTNGHHLLEASFKALGLALQHALQVKYSIQNSTKGVLD
ncbi:imidazoleglycerol-phosphate dehydratase [Desulfonauticus submarinus]|uniref:Imidazoleglycerol-phosphate dehydratase n=2 Tax=Desulfonauticus submarinus TaxID=206665 RepID=A0A1H0A902_9BACT|nr:imidazoleglycerol-phosphate dehydratase [Desulfonauticus submarinus]